MPGKNGRIEAGFSHLGWTRVGERINDIPTKEALAATLLLRKYFPDLKIRFVKMGNLHKRMASTEPPHGLSDRNFDSLFTKNRTIIFHSHPWLIHRFGLAIDVIDRVPKFQRAGAHPKEMLQDMQIECKNYAYKRWR